MFSMSTEDGALLRYRDSGPGKPLILLHGWAASGAFFDGQAELAAQGWRLIVPDLRGHGASQGGTAPLSLALLAADLAALIAHLKLRHYALAGWSMGAMVAWQYLRDQGRAGLLALTVIDMTPKIVSDGQWNHGLAGAYPATAVEGTLRAIRADWPRYAGLSAGRLFARGRTPDPALLQQCTGIMQGNGAEGLAQLWADMANQDYREVLPLMGADCQFIYGQGSRLYTPETFIHLAQLARTPHLSAVPGAGHMPQKEQPQAFNAALLEHLQTRGQVWGQVRGQVAL